MNPSYKMNNNKQLTSTALKNYYLENEVKACVNGKVKIILIPIKNYMISFHTTDFIALTHSIDYNPETEC